MTNSCALHKELNMADPLNLGQLVDAIREVEAAETRIEDADRAVGHGGNENTMRRKHQEADDARQHLADLRAQPTNVVIVER
jgi:hypothetical protein